MTTYTHDNGVIVGGTDSPAEIAIWNALADGLGDRQYIHPPQAEAIHAAYLHSLGLALFEHDGDRWLIPLEGHSSRGGRYVMRISNHVAYWSIPAPSTSSRYDRTLAAYLAAHTPPAQPKPSEQWLLSVGLDAAEQETEVVKVGGERYFAWQDGRTKRMTPTLVRVADRHPSTYRRAES